jgi:pre-mRNA-processing factor 19
VPEEPVISKKSGLLFERRLIEKVVQETGRCPITDEPLEKDDLVVVSTGNTIKPRPTPATSIPGLLSLLQNEWDATVLEAHQLRQALHAARQELSHALYQHDAATRVIGTFLKLSAFFLSFFLLQLNFFLPTN